MSNQETTVVEQIPANEAEVETLPTSEETVPTSAAEDTSASTSPETSVPSVESTENAPADGALSIHNLQIGQRLTGKVKNIAEFGAFVDIGIAQDGLVHISELAKQKVEKVTDVVSQGQEVEVWVKKVDTKRGRISLTMIKPIGLKLRDIAEEAEVEGVVTRLEPYGAFVDIGTDRDGLVHISQITYDYIKHPEDALQVGQKVNVKVLKVNRKKRQVDLSIKALLPPPPPPEEVKKVEETKSQPRREVIQEEIVEEEPLPTAMAIAYAALQDELPQTKASKNILARNKDKSKKKEMDDIVARTLANRDQ
ncbi:MAG TPA: S1 RNA-binding domain-containing protein [Anaerolineae bacterium]|nr:S1 RNA-binding domain-containing protein [Anaerolineae bacterium]